MNTMNKKSYHHDDLRQELIAAGIEQLAKEGAQSLSLRKVAAECGVSHAAPYKHFKNKNELLSSIIEYVMGEFSSELQQFLDNTPGNPTRRMLELGKGFVHFMVEHPAYFHILFSGGFIPPMTREIVANGDSIYNAFPIFRKTSIEYLESRQIPKDEYYEHILAMYAVVHGLSMMLINQNVRLEADYLATVDKILNTILI